MGASACHVALNGNEVEGGGREVGDAAAFLMGHVAGHRQGLEIDFRPHHGRADAEEDAAFEPIDGVADGQKIAVAGGAERGRIEVGMLVQDVVADADVDRDRHVQPHAGGEDAEVLVRIIAFEDVPADRSRRGPGRAAAPSRTMSFISPVSRQRPNSPLRM